MIKSHEIRMLLKPKLKSNAYKVSMQSADYRVTFYKYGISTFYKYGISAFCME